VTISISMEFSGTTVMDADPGVSDAAPNTSSVRQLQGWLAGYQARGAARQFRLSSRAIFLVPAHLTLPQARCEFKCESPAEVRGGLVALIPDPYREWVSCTLVARQSVYHDAHQVAMTERKHVLLNQMTVSDDPFITPIRPIPDLWFPLPSPGVELMVFHEVHFIIDFFEYAALGLGVWGQPPVVIDYGAQSCVITACDTGTRYYPIGDIPVALPIEA
jgi:hypothetical protein